MSTNQAVIVARMGASGSGKSLDVKNKLREGDVPRLLMWDTMNEYTEHAERVASLSELVKRASSAPTFKLRYVPERVDPKKLVERFDAFCAVAYHLGDLVMVVEELQTVTSPSYAPASWSDCTLRGRHRGLSIIGLAQRPASVDKNFFSNCTLVITGRLNYVEDVRCMSNVLGVPDEVIGALRPLEFIQRNMTTGETAAGEVPLPGQTVKPLRAIGAAADPGAVLPRAASQSGSGAGETAARVKRGSIRARRGDRQRNGKVRH